MSKKTENINNCLEKLASLQKRLESEAGRAGERELQDISFELSQEIKNLNFWINSLYSFNGKSRSYLKQKASRENGKKGGRPPKKITDLKKSINSMVLEIEDISHSLKMTNSLEEETQLLKKKNLYEAKVNEMEQELEIWNKNKIVN